MDTTPSSPIRREARTIILQVIEDHVRGPIQTLPVADLKELRPLIRAAYPWPEERKGWKVRVWRQEVRAALGYQIRKPRRHVKIAPVDADRVMPSMRAWAKERGLAVDPLLSEDETQLLELPISQQ